MKEIVLRFLVGGAVVSFFSVAGDMLKPKSFAGLLGAAPSVRARHAIARGHERWQVLCRVTNV